MSVFPVVYRQGMASSRVLRFPHDPRRGNNNRQPVDFLKKIDTSHPELYLEQNSEVKKSHERIHAFGNEDDENEAQ